MGDLIFIHFIPQIKSYCPFSSSHLQMHLYWKPLKMRQFFSCYIKYSYMYSYIYS